MYYSASFAPATIAASC